MCSCIKMSMHNTQRDFYCQPKKTKGLTGQFMWFRHWNTSTKFRINVQKGDFEKYGNKKPLFGHWNTTSLNAIPNLNSDLWEEQISKRISRSFHSFVHILNIKMMYLFPCLRSNHAIVMWGCIPGRMVKEFPSQNVYDVPFTRMRSLI